MEKVLYTPLPQILFDLLAHVDCNLNVAHESPPGLGHNWRVGVIVAYIWAIGHFDSKMQGSTIILTNKSSTSTIQIPHFAIVKLEPSDDDVFILLDCNDEVFLVIELSNTSSLFLRKWYAF